MSPTPSKAPDHPKPGTKSKTEANNSKTPVPILPQGSAFNFEKIATDSGAPVNLKNRVCKKIKATRIRKQIRIRFFFERSNADKKILLGLFRVLRF